MPEGGPSKKRLPSLPGNPAKRLAESSSAGYDLAANVLVGIALGWALHHFWEAARPWGFLGGMALGIVSGFWQLFKTQLRPAKKKAPEEPKA